MNADTTAGPGSDRILPLTRVVAVIVIPFLVVAFAILYFVPDRSGELFAWPIRPPMTAMMLGAAYAGGIYFFTRVLFARRWHRVKAGYPPVIAFATMLGIATLLHWDRFTHTAAAFWAWAGLYFSTPVIVSAVWLLNRGRDPHGPEPNDAALGRLVRLVIGAYGAVMLAVSLFLFVQPAAMIAIWPWTLSPLTARVAGAMFALPGLVGIGIALDARWTAARLILESQAVSIALILLAAVRDWGAFRPGYIATWLFAGGLAAMLVGIVSLYLALEAPGRREPGPALITYPSKDNP